jgi:hypothetical protein
MKLSIVAIFFLISLGCLSAQDGFKSSIRFSNSDYLSGAMESLSTKRLVWKSPMLEKPAPFFLKDILDLSLEAVVPDIKARHEASLTLTNGDLIRGQLAMVTDGTIALDTWFAGRMEFKRLMIADLKIAGRPELIYQGPRSLEGWKQAVEKPAWIYQNSGFRSVGAGGIARNVKLPDECRIAFDASWKGSFGLKLVFFSNEVASDRPASGYEITFQQRSVNLRSGKTQKFLGQTSNAIALQENEKARIEVRASLKSGKICFLVDGEIIEVWTDPDGIGKGGGQGIHFIAQNLSPVQVSRIEVAAWDGEVNFVPDAQRQIRARQAELQEDGDELAPEPPEASKAGRMELDNGDSITGEVVSIVDGMITVKTPFREVRLPVENLRSVALKPVDLERCKRENGDVRGWFPDGSSMVFRLDDVHEGELYGSSQNFGNARFKVTAFNRIEFNIYDPELEVLRLSSGS